MISSLLVHRRRVALARPFVTAIRTATHLDVTLVEARDDSGRSGWGEAAVSWRVTGESPESVAAVVSGPLADVTLGRESTDPALATDIAAAVIGNAAARSALESAIDDLTAPRHGEVRTDITLSSAGTAETVAAAEAHAAAGFRTLKLKVTGDTDLVSTLAAVHAAVGDGIRLRIDANQAWTATEAIEKLRAVEAAGLALEFVEQPVAARDIAALAEVRAGTAFPILADEAVRTTADLDALLTAGAADAVNIKLAKTGGAVEARRLAHAATNAGLGVVFGCMLESTVGIGATARVAEQFAPDIDHDLDGGLWLAEQAVSGGTAYDGPRIRCSATAPVTLREPAQTLAFAQLGSAA